MTIPFYQMRAASGKPAATAAAGNAGVKGTANRRSPV